MKLGNLSFQPWGPALQQPTWKARPQPLQQWAPGFSAWSVTATFLIFLPFNLVPNGGNQICHLSSHLGRPSSSCLPPASPHYTLWVGHAFPLSHQSASHSSVCPESQPRRVVLADSLLWRQILKKQWRIGKISWSRKQPPLQYSCLENSMKRGAWPSAGRGVTTSQTRLSMHTQTQACLFMSTELRVRTK